MVINPVKSIQGSKDKRHLNVFGIYDHTNNQMWTHSTNKRQENNSLILKRVDQKYYRNIKQISLILDNASIHKSNKVKETLAKHHHPRIHLVFLPTRSPDLNLIEVRWMWMHRQAINNSTFLNNKILVRPYQTGHMIITKNMQAKQAVLVYRKKAFMYLHNC